MSRVLCHLAVILCVLVFSAFSADFYVASGASGSFSLLSNWVNGALPGPGDNIFMTASGSASLTFDLTSTLAGPYGNIFINASSGQQNTLSITSPYFESSGIVTIGANGVLTMSTGGVFGGSASAIIEQGGTLTLAGGTMSLGSSSTVSVNAGATVTTTASSVFKTAQLVISGGANLAVQSGQTLSMESNAQINFAASASMAILTTIGQLTFDSSSSINVEAGASVTQSGSGSVTGQGSWYNHGTYILATSASATSTLSTAIAQNTGVFKTSGSGYVMLTSSYSQVTNGSTNSNWNAMMNCTSSTGFTIANGTLSGSGTIYASVYVSGVLSAGNSPGTQTIVGDLTCDQSCLMVIEIAGTNSNEFDNYVVTGTVTIDGYVEFEAINPYSFTVGDQFTFLTGFSSISYSPQISWLWGNGFAFKEPRIVQPIGGEYQMQVASLFSSGMMNQINGFLLVLCLVIIHLFQ